MTAPAFDFDRLIDRRSLPSEKWGRYAGRDVLPLWVADMDFAAPPAVIEALHRRIDHGVFGYTDSGNPEFALACARWMKVRFGWEADPAWVEFAPGVCAGLALCVKAYTDPGDNIVMFTPTYPPFYAISKSNGRNPVSICRNQRSTYALFQNKTGCYLRQCRRLADPRRADHQDVFRHDFIPDFLRKLRAAIAVAQGDGDGALGLVLTDDIAIQLANNLFRRQFHIRHPPQSRYGW